MTIEVVLLALASTVRPTSLAAVYALVGSESPRRLMIVYITAGLTFTIAFGLLVIWAFNGVDINSGRDETKGIAEIVGGIVVLTFAVLVLTGHVGGPHADDAPDAPSRWKTLLERRLSADTAALAGPATHIPGLFYLIALNVIAAHQPSIPDGLVEVLIYNVVWFALPIGALAICVIDPPAARRAVDELRMWTLSHTRTLLLTVSLVAGAGLVIRGRVDGLTGKRWSGAEDVDGPGHDENHDGVGDQRLHRHEALRAARQRHRVRRAHGDRVGERHVEVVAQPWAPIAAPVDVLRELEVGIGPPTLGALARSALVELPEQQPEGDDVGEPDDRAMGEQLARAEARCTAADQGGEEHADGGSIGGDQEPEQGNADVPQPVQGSARHAARRAA